MKTGVPKERNDSLGAINEMRATIEFLANGCEVFRNVRQHGCVDIVVIHPDGTVEKLDVKTRCERKRDRSPIHRARSDKQKQWDVRLFYIDENHEGHYHPPKGIYENI